MNREAWWAEESMGDKKVGHELVPKQLQQAGICPHDGHLPLASRTNYTIVGPNANVNY